MASITAEVTEAMRGAVRQFAKARGVTISDVVVQALRNAGFEREEVLEALARGECPDIDVRRRTPAAFRSSTDRVREYMAERGCHTLQELSRMLHLKAPETRRAIVALREAGLVKQKPFDRPVIWHWCPTCKCAVAPNPDL